MVVALLSGTVSPLLLAFDRLILAIFTAEAALKMAAQGRLPWRYFADRWNVLTSSSSCCARCRWAGRSRRCSGWRALRLLRLLRLVSALPKLQLLVGALLKSLSAMGYVGLLLALLFYIYAVAGIHLFGKTEPVHLGSLPTALLSLFRLVTLDDWADIFDAQLAHVAGFQRRHLLCHLNHVRHDDQERTSRVLGFFKAEKSIAALKRSRASSEVCDLKF